MSSELVEMMYSLLAIIHRDGGQHTSRVGAAQSLKEACQLSSNRIAAEVEAAALRIRLETTEAALQAILMVNGETYVGDVYEIRNIAAAALTPEQQPSKCQHVPPSEPRWFQPCPKCGYGSPDISKRRHAPGEPNE